MTALTTAVLRLLRDDALAARLSAAAEQKARRSFSSAHQVDRTIAVYRAVA